MEQNIKIGFMIKVTKNVYCPRTDNIWSQVMLDFLMLTFLQITNSWNGSSDPHDTSRYYQEFTDFDSKAFCAIMVVTLN